MNRVTIVYSTKIVDGVEVPDSYQVIHPSNKFQGNAQGLAESISGSNLSIGVKNFKYYYSS